MTEQLVHVGDLDLCYEEFGSPDDPALLLIMGLGTQMLAWRPEFCAALAAEGFRVIRFDNRDIGRSTHLSGKRPPGLLELATRRIRDPAYTLDDMAEDTVGLMDALGLGDAHLVGASMGGMIAQQAAAHHPDRVRSLTSIMSTTGARRVGQPALRVLPLLGRPPAKERQASIDRTVALFDIVGSPGFERDVAITRERAGESFDRDSNRSGGGRQLGAILASGDRTDAVRRITAPTLVIHGTADRLVDPSGGRATAKAIRGARLELIEGMGHDLPEGVWDRIVGLVASHARAADRARPELTSA